MSTPMTPGGEPTHGWGTPPPSTPKNNNTAVKIVIIVAVVVIVLAIVGSHNNSSTSSTSSSNDAPALDDTSSDPGPSAGAVLDTPSWAAPASAAVQEQSAVLTAITDDAGNEDLVAVLADCQRGADEMTGWQAIASSIDVESVRTPYTQALSEYSQAFTLCAAGNLGDAAPHIQSGTSYIVEATSALNAYNAG